MKLSPLGALLLVAVVCAADDDGHGSRATISNRKTTTSNHLGTFRPETALNSIDALRENRLLRKLADGNNFHLFAKSGKAATTKSDKAAKSSKALGSKAKAQNQKVEDDSSSSTLFTTCADVQAKLDTCEAAAAAPSWMFVQLADECTLFRDEDGVYHLESNKFHEDTEWFTDRPMQLEKTEPTSEWFANFNGLFDDEKGMPNAALTIVDDDTSKDVVVSVFAQGYIKEGEESEVPTYGYVLEQSSEQESVMSLEDMMEGEDSVVFDHCSMFIE